MSLSHASAHAPADPGRQKMYVRFATPANARDCRVEVLIVSNDSTRNISPKPVISLSRRGLIASGVPSLPVTPVPPVVSMTSGLGSAIHGDTAALILYISSGTTTFRVRCDSRNAICHTGFFRTCHQLRCVCRK